MINLRLRSGHRGDERLHNVAWYRPERIGSLAARPSHWSGFFCS